MSFVLAMNRRRVFDNLVSLRGHDGAATSVCAFDLDGKPMVASAGVDGTVRMWDPATGTAHLDPLDDHADAVRKLATCEVDGRTMLVAASWDGTVRNWNPSTGRQVGAAVTMPSGEQMPGFANSSQFMLDGRLVVCPLRPDELTWQLWDPLTEQPIGEPFVGHTDRVMDVRAFDLDGRTLLASCSYDGSLRLWDPTTSRQVGPSLVGHQTASLSVCGFTVHGRTLLASGGDDGVRIWDPSIGAQLGYLLRARGGEFNGICAFELEGQARLATACYAGTIDLWDPFPETPESDVEGVRELASVTSPDGAPLVACHELDGWVQVRDAQTGEAVRAPFAIDRAASLAGFDEAGAPMLACLSGDAETIRVLDPLASVDRAPIDTGHTSTWASACCAVALPDRTLLASATRDEIRLHDTTTGVMWGQPITDRDDDITGLCSFDFEGTTVIAWIAGSGLLRMWDPAAGCFVGPRIAARDRMYRVVPYTSRTTSLLCCVGDQITVRSARTGRIVARHDLDATHLLTVTIDGESMLIAASRHGRVWAFDPRTGLDLDGFDLTFSDATITALCDLGNGRVAVGMLDGLATIQISSVSRSR